ncbi:ATP-binding protein [Pseudoalteromonas xiamenensis]|uniref:sensor histidine kinase n=1 Tax=Pseudoalteromonas xiamenensis TaxID=882626 RepID=UPI0027E4C5E9|nr:ATP-binding protein [Pseudoalteromonas xiamenensis]WMN60746.1 ATP-binding protein [Pseudoalteromonas xiamenensis]WMN60849.1 ATP-binding protein [Pseudoalteromonas xiamenensis]
MGLDTLCDTEDETLRTKYELRINQNLDDMEALINALLNFARLQHSLNDTEKSLVNVQTVVSQLCTKANDPRLLLFIEGDEHSVVGHEYYLSLLFSNLVTNALKHCNEKVHVTLSQANSAVLVSVEDDGTGIAASEAEKIFKPFVRLAKQTAASKEGFGIGLALVERITLWLQGDVNVDTSEQLGGAHFVVTLPLLKPSR